MLAFRTLPILLLATALTVVAGCDDDNVTPPPTATPQPAATDTPTVAPTATAVPPTATAIPPTPTLFPPPTFTATSVPSSTATASPVPTDTVPPTATFTETSTATPSASPTPATPTPTFTDRQLLESVASAESWSFSGLEDEVQVLRTEGNVPHIYATNRRDLSYVHGFLLARDRYFMMDLTRRLGRGRTSELIGDSALDVDIESRMTGLTHVADRLADNLTAEQRVLADAFAAGVNEYIALAAARQVPLPSELRLAGPLLGASNPATLMVPFTYRDVASILAVIMYQSSYETGDVGRDATYANIGEPFAGDPFEELRMAGLLQDVAPSIDPVYPISSGAGFGLETGDTFIPGPLPEDVPGAIANGPPVARRARRSGPSGDLLAALAEKLEAFETRLGRFEGFGSNSWAVSGTTTNSGASLLAGDGHLGLDVPPIFFQIGLDTSLLGGGDVHQIGLTIPGFLVMPVGTNGDVAWCQTQLSADATDWYAEEIRLDANGLPEASLFQGEWEPLVRVDETFTIANVPALDSVGRTEVWPRFKTFDGRFLTAIEGRRVAADAEVGEGESVVMTLSGFVVPRDQNADGIVSAVTFDFTGLDVGSLLSSTDGFGLAADVEEFRQSARGLVGYSQNIIAADKNGGILYTSKDAVPCRGYLPRNPDGSWAEGADPRRVLDGTIYPGFEVPLTDGVVDEDASGGDPRRCIVPFDSTPQSLSPSRGYVLTANNDPGNIALDSSLENDPWYIGGPWNDGFRAETIDRRLAELAASGDADVDEMARLQGNHESRLGELFGPRLIEAIQTGRMLTMVDRILTPDEDRLAALYSAESTALDEIEQRLTDWAAGGYEAESGVETFYHVVAPGEPENAVATMIFNAWIGRFLRGVWNDEGFSGGFFDRGDLTRIKLINEFLEARDAGEARGLASFNAETGEPIFFDVRGTEPVERSREIMLAAMNDALAFLRSPQASPGNGGFGTDDMSQWIWGLRHQVKFESLLAPFLGNDPTFEVFTRPFNIDTNKLPLAPNLPTDDPRFGLRWFPRPGDQWGVDAANPGFSGTNFTHGSGPVMRMVFALKDGEVSGLNVIPGGQSGLTDSPYFTDQAALWLANEAYPIRFSIADVVAGATKREVYRPTGCTSAESCEEFEYCQDPIGSNALSSCGICCVTSEPDACGLTLCDTDDDCTEAGDVCQPAEPVDCLCEPATVCRPGCVSEADCHPGETCDADGHCIATPCTTDGDCPAEFLCNGNSVCERRTCTGSGECGGGACVNGACYSEPGTCEPYGV